MQYCWQFFFFGKEKQNGGDDQHLPAFLLYSLKALKVWISTYELIEFWDLSENDLAAGLLDLSLDFYCKPDRLRRKMSVTQK